MQDDKKLGTLSAGDVRPLRRLSDDPVIRDIFRYKLWRSDEASLYLLGVYKIINIDDNNHIFVMLDGRSLKDPEDSVEMDEIWGRCERLRDIWKSFPVERRHRPVTYIRMGFKDRDLCDMHWLGDAVQQGLLGSDVDRLLPVVVQSSSKQPKISNSDDSSGGKNIAHSQRRVLYTIIRGLLAVAYKNDLSRGIKAKVIKDFELLGISISNGPFYEHINAALDIDLSKKAGVEGPGKDKSK